MCFNIQTYGVECFRRCIITASEAGQSGRERQHLHTYDTCSIEGFDFEWVVGYLSVKLKFSDKISNKIFPISQLCDDGNASLSRERWRIYSCRSNNRGPSPLRAFVPRARPDFPCSMFCSRIGHKKNAAPCPKSVWSRGEFASRSKSPMFYDTNCTDTCELHENCGCGFAAPVCSRMSLDKSRKITLIGTTYPDGFAIRKSNIYIYAYIYIYVYI